jgi:hypothetical protein
VRGFFGLYGGAVRGGFVHVPDRIVIAFFPKLRLYGFRPVESWFPELLKTLEMDGATGLGWRRALGTGGIGLAEERVQLLGRDWSFLPGLPGLVLMEPAFEHADRGAEVVAEGDEQVDVIQVFLA